MKENDDEIGLTKIKTKNNIYFVSSVRTVQGRMREKESDWLKLSFLFMWMLRVWSWLYFTYAYIHSVCYSF